ncbi:proline-rich protein RiP-15 [Naviculisporaceae sp. PSN 640]
MSQAPPPPPPHGENPKTTAGGGSGLPPGKYDIFIIPEHSAGSGFLYLPSLKPQWNSFIAGVASTLMAVVLGNTFAPVVKAWWAGFQGFGTAGLTLLMLAIGLGAWSLGKSQSEKGQSSHSQSHGGSQQRPGGAFNHSGGFYTPPPNGAPPPNTGPQPPPPPPPPHTEPPNNDRPSPGQSWQEAPRPEPRPQPQPQYHPPPPPPPPQPEPQRAPEPEPPKPEPPKPEPPKPEPPKPKPPPPQPQAAPKPQPAPTPPPPRPSPTKTETPKGAWEKAREETRRREEERKAKEAENKRREEAARRLAELREKDKREREQREREARERETRERLKKEQEAREKERLEKELREKVEKELREKVEREAREKAEKELREKEAARKREEEQAQRLKELQAAREREAKERAERLKKEEEEKNNTTRKGSTYAFSSVGERTSMWPNGRPPAPASSASGGGPKSPTPAPAASPRQAAAPSPSPSPTKPTPQPARSATGTEDTYSYRPYDKPKKPTARKKSVSDFSESSWAPSSSTARTTPPPSVREPYTTNDPNKIVIKAVYGFLNQFSKTPASQLVSGVGTVTDGLILRINSAGLFVDDDVRDVPQREWDVKAWTIKLIEVWCPTHAVTSTPGSVPTNHPFFKAIPASHRRAAERGATKTFVGEEAFAYLEEFGKACKTTCALGPSRNSASGSSVNSSGGRDQTGEWKAKGLHLLRVTMRDQEGKRHLFVVSEEESWKIARGLQQLRSGSQVRALNCAGFSGMEAKNILETLGWG